MSNCRRHGRTLSEGVKLGPFHRLDAEMGALLREPVALKFLRLSVGDDG
ncbi:hypothetical protein SAMN05892883_3871 [Jatrophihabitans sp. GAS493]|nr:hypothetical protein SAMN05892883_3871 [Jatrophihabitans sp. GAS493]